MFKSYIRIAWRNLANNKVSSLINVSGLAAGMAVAMLIGLWIYDELSFDTYHKNYDRIAQVMSSETDEGEVGINNNLPYPLAIELKAHYQSNFKHIVVASASVREYILSAGDRNLISKGQYMEAGAPDMLSLKMLTGSANGLKDPHAILLAASTAKAFFGEVDPVNQLMKINNKQDVKVAGVYEDLPLNTQFNELKFIAPFELWVAENAWAKEAVNNWSNHFLKVYVEINPDTDMGAVTANIKDAELKNLGNFKEQAAQNPQVFLHPMRSWHLYGYKKGAVNSEPVDMLWLIGVIGAFVLLLACINFVNLSTARSEKRAKEVGIRKAIGSRRSQLIKQFFSESLGVVIVSFLVSLFIVTLLLPWFNNLAGKQMAMPWVHPFFWSAGLLFILITGLLAGSYPAIYLSSFKPVKVLKGTFRISHSAITPRRVLVVAQFTVSVALIISTIIIYRQIQFAKDRPVGYDREGLVMLEMKGNDFAGKYEVLRTELKNSGAVAEVSRSMGRLTEVWSSNDGWDWKGKTAATTRSFGTLTVSPEHGKTIGWQLLKGRDFSSELATDSSGILINEAAMQYMNMTNPVGETVSWKFRNKTASYQILGVVKDMVMESPYEPVKPVIFFIKAPNGVPNWINIKINPAIGAHEALQKMEAVFKQVVPSTPFNYKFVGEAYTAKFIAEERMVKLATFFAGLAIFISCLGLFGLASFVAEQRTKEIGIRKVVGASVFSLWKLLSKDFVILVLISCLIAVPVSLYYMQGWLQQFQYRTSLSWWIFAAAIGGALLITLLTVSFQSIKAALMNPVKSLRTE